MPALAVVAGYWTERPNLDGHPVHPHERESCVSGHHPLTESWLCLACGADWPCRTRRLQLTAHYLGRPEQLAFHLAGHYVRARLDLTHVPVLLLYRRFLGWMGDLAATDRLGVESPGNLGQHHG
jgi:hypothetical protein